MRWAAFLIVLLAVPQLFAQSDSDDAAKAKVIALEKAWNQASKGRYESPRRTAR
jgi:hypothetical protein